MEGCYVPLLGKRPHKWTSQGPKAAIGESCYEAPHRRFGMTPGQRRGHLPSFVWTQHREVKQGKSRSSVGTTDQGKGRGSREGKIGQGGRGRAKGGERPMGPRPMEGKAKGKEREVEREG